MKHKLTYTDNYILVVDDSEIKEGECYFNNTGLKIERYNYKLPSSGQFCKKIIAHLPLNNSPILEGVPLLPPREQEDDVEKLAHYEYRVNLQPNGRTLAGGKYDVDINYESRIGFTKGYNKAKEKYKYTEKDMVEAMLLISEYYADSVDSGGVLKSFLWRNIAHLRLDVNKTANYIIQSLSQPKMPTHFECGMEHTMIRHNSCINRCASYPMECFCEMTKESKPKTTTNSQGQTVWVGNYIQEP